MSEQIKANNRIKEYIAILKTKTIQDLKSFRENLLAKFKAEREKLSPNKKLVNDYNVQLSLLGREIKSRQPIHEQGDTATAVQDATINEVKPKTFEEKLKEKTLDELNAMVVNGKAKLDKLNLMKSDPNISADELKKTNDRINHFGEKLSAIQAEIATRSESASTQAKADVNNASTSSSTLFGIDKDYIVPAVAGGVIVGVIGYSIGKSIIGFGVLGLGIGAGIVWLNKNSSSPKPVTP